MANQCRLCLRCEDGCEDASSGGLHDMINQLFALSINPGEVSTAVCRNCNLFVNNFYTFHQQVKNSQKIYSDRYHPTQSTHDFNLLQMKEAILTIENDHKSCAMKDFDTAESISKLEIDPNIIRKFSYSKHVKKMHSNSKIALYKKSFGADNNRNFRDRNPFKMHVDHHHEIKRLQLKISKGNKYSPLLRHFSKRYNCRDCDFTCHLQSLINIHMKIKHSKDNKNQTTNMNTTAI